MRTTVYVVTNRQPAPPDAPPQQAFTASMRSLESRRLSCGVAFVANTDPDPETLDQRRVEEVGDIQDDRFSAQAEADILGSGKNLLVFVHGFANAFEDALKRAAFNREWLAASGIAAADCVPVLFTWPSSGRVVDGQDVPAGAATLLATLLGFVLDGGNLHSPLARQYFRDRDNARGSGRDLARLIDRLGPLAAEVQRQGRRVFLLVHSMGHLALAAACAEWENAGQTPAVLFDEAVLAAPDSPWAEAERAPQWLPWMARLARRTTLYSSTGDRILDLSRRVNGIQRLGTAGPPDREDKTVFPPNACGFVDCGGVMDELRAKDIDYTHQYYRRIKAVRDDIADVLAGTARPWQKRL